MTGYFHRLSQQTGLQIGSGGDLKSGGRKPSFSGSKQVGKTTPLHVEETRLIKPQLVPRIERGTRVENIPESTPEGFEGKIEGEATIPTADETKTADRTGKAREHAPEKEESGIPPASEEGGPKDTAAVDKSSEEATLAKRETVENGLPDQEEIPLHDDSSVPSVTIKQRILTGGKEREDRPDDEAGRQPTLMEVREWVAETPDAEFEEIVPKKDEKETGHIAQIEPSEPVAHEDFSIASRPETVEYPPSVEPETRDFHVSIGAIQLTIEEPPEKIADKEPQRIMKERKDKPQAQSTRLARHYIRI